MRYDSIYFFEQKQSMKKINAAFSLIEILIGILIVSFVILAWFEALSAIGVWKIKLIEKSTIEKEAFFAGEKFFEMIKTWGTVDYEEYWNRYSSNTVYSSGHFLNKSGFWNFGRSGNPGTSVYWQKFYYCISGNWLANVLSGSWCLSNAVWRKNSNNLSMANTFQRFGQYEQQFIDYNSDYDNNSPLWDEDSDGNIVWDADDLFMWLWPQAFPNSTDVWELYLINWTGTERTFFRWNVWLDPDRPSWSVCTWTKIMTWTGCLWTIEFLKLQGRDWWFDHISWWSPDADGSQNDWIIDTWIIDPEFVSWWTTIIADSNITSYWQPIFPNSIHVKNVEFYTYPYKSLKYSFRDASDAVKMAPYVQIKITLQPSWQQKRKIKWSIPEVTFSSTIELTELNFD